MKKIHNAEQLNTYLDSEIAWRKRELSALKLLIKAKGNPKNTLNCLYRSGTTLLYAHWEGFIKAAAEAYLRFIATQALNYDELSISILALSLRGKFNEAVDSKKIVKYTYLVNFFINELTSRSRIPWDSTIRTNSNLSSDVLEEITQNLGLDYADFELKRKMIDEKLVKRRNQIAHGEYLDLTEIEYSELQEEIVTLMDLFRNQIDNSAALKTYMKNRPGAKMLTPL